MNVYLMSTVKLILVKFSVKLILVKFYNVAIMQNPCSAPTCLAIQLLVDTYLKDIHK